MTPTVPGVRVGSSVSGTRQWYRPREGSRPGVNEDVTSFNFLLCRGQVYPSPSPTLSRPGPSHPGSHRRFPLKRTRDQTARELCWFPPVGHRTDPSGRFWGNFRTPGRLLPVRFERGFRSFVLAPSLSTCPLDEGVRGRTRTRSSPLGL